MCCVYIHRWCYCINSNSFYKEKFYVDIKIKYTILQQKLDWVFILAKEDKMEHVQVPLEMDAFQYQTSNRESKWMVVVYVDVGEGEG
jgi:hypothetical protein